RRLRVREARLRLHDLDRVLRLRLDEALRLIEVAFLALDRRLGNLDELLVGDGRQVRGRDVEPDVELRGVDRHACGVRVELGRLDVQARLAEVIDPPVERGAEADTVRWVKVVGARRDERIVVRVDTGRARRRRAGRGTGCERDGRIARDLREVDAAFGGIRG